MPRPDDVPVTRTGLPFRSSPARTSSVVDVAPNFAVISDHLVDRPMQWLGGEWKQAARSDCRQSGVEPGHGDGNVPKPLGKRRVFSLRCALGLSGAASDPSESGRAAITSLPHGA